MGFHVSLGECNPKKPQRLCFTALGAFSSAHRSHANQKGRAIPNPSKGVLEFWGLGLKDLGLKDLGFGVEGFSA